MFKYVQNRIIAGLKLILIGLDVLSINLSLFFALELTSYFSIGHVFDLQSVVFRSLWLEFNLLFVLSVLVFGAYTDSSIIRIENMFRATFRAGLTLILTFSFMVILGHTLENPFLFLLILSVLLSSYYLLSRFFMTYVYTVLPRRYNITKRVALIGHGDYLGPVANHFDKQDTFYAVDTIAYKDEDAREGKTKTLTRFREYFEAVTREGIHDVFIVSSPDVNRYSKDLIQEADHQCVQLNFVPAMTASIVYNDQIESHFKMELPVLRSHEEPMSTMENRIKKRFVDLLISSLVIVFILSWMIPIIGLIIKIQSPGPIFFKQLRSGRNNKPFYCYKFRSMVVNKHSDGKQATKGDKRITPIGKFLRKTNLDEFPQFINVFLGNMSVVGPRPHMLAHTEHYSNLIKHYMVRHFVKPGITGWAQVNGYRGETTEPSLMAKRVEFDIEYLRNWSAMLDFKIVSMTAINMIKGEKNAY